MGDKAWGCPHTESLHGIRLIVDMSTPPSCLVLHGYGGAPFDVSFLVQALHEEGLTVRSPCLPGHGQDHTVFARSRFSHWLEAADTHLTDMLAQGPCMLIGLSMGGSLALSLAQRRNVAGVVTIAAPVFLYTLIPWSGASRLLPLVPWLRFIRPVVPVPLTSEHARRIAPHGGYEGFQPLHTLHSFINGLRPIKAGLAHITAPICVLHSPQDQTVPVANAWHILRSVSSRVRELELLPITEQVTNRHLLTTHVETRDLVQDAVLRFLHRPEVGCVR
ncbi:MAG: alpha/beta fold hydrolase [Desulfovermiculus sp.]